MKSKWLNEGVCKRVIVFFMSGTHVVDINQGELKLHADNLTKFLS